MYCGQCGKKVIENANFCGHCGSKIEKINFQVYNHQLFHETHSYKNIHMDANSRLFYIGDRINENTIFLTFDNIDYCKVKYIVPAGTSTILGYAKCNVSICIKMKSPKMVYNYTLYDQAPATYEDTEYCGSFWDFWDDDIYDGHIDIYSYDWPRSLKSFLEHFYSRCKSARGCLFDDSDGFEDNTFEYDSKLKSEADLWLETIDEEMNRQEKQKPQQTPEEQARLEFSNMPATSTAKSSNLSADEYAEIMEFLQNQDS